MSGESEHRVPRVRFALLGVLAPFAASCLVTFPDYATGDLSGNAGRGGSVALGGAAGVSGSSGGGGKAGTGGAAGSTGGSGAGGAGASGVGGAGAGGVSGGAGGAGAGGASGSAGSSGAAGRGRLVINEIDYDQLNTDSTEYVEIYNASATDTASLDDLELVFVNGEGTVNEYLIVSLSGALEPHGFAVVASPLVTVAAGAVVFRFQGQDNNIQNGPSDAVGIFDTDRQVLLDALSYEGSVSGVTLAGGTGTYDFVEGTATTAADNPTAGQPNGALVRLPDGTDSQNANADWSVTSTLTPGSPNM